MKNIIYILTFLLLGFNNVNSQTLEQILEKHYEAVGMEYLKKVQTMQYKGKYINHFLKKDGAEVQDYYLNMDFILSIDKQKSYLEQVFGIYGEDVYAYSNGKYWRDPSGDVPAESIPNRFEKIRIQLRIDIESVLYNWKKKDYSLTRLKDAIFENKTYYKIRLTTTEKDTLYFYLNPKTHLIYKMSYYGDLTDGKEHLSTTFLEYKEVNNIYFPFKHIQRSQMLDGSYGDKEVAIKEIRINPKFDKELFDIQTRINNQKKESK